MGSPFLKGGFNNPSERLEAIALEVQYYLEHNSGFMLPPGVEPPDELPEALFWLTLSDRHNLLCPGSYLEQPHYFLDDLEAARVGRKRFQDIEEMNERNEENQNPLSLINFAQQ